MKVFFLVLAVILGACGTKGSAVPPATVGATDGHADNATAAVDAAAEVLQAVDTLTQDGGEIVTGTDEDFQSPSECQRPDCVRFVTPGPLQVFALTLDGHLRTWGAQLTTGLKGAPESIDVLVPTEFAGPPGLVQLSGAIQFCGLTASGQVYCWGANTWGGVGVMTSPAPVATSPLLVVGADKVVQVSCGHEFTLAARSDGSVLAWGMNLQGQLGDGTTKSTFAPQPVPGITEVVQVAAGFNRSCVLHKNHDVTCWGGQSESGAVVKPSVTLSGAVLISGSCAIMANATVTCGLGLESSPWVVTGLGAVVDLSGSDGNSCAVKMDGTVWCWNSSPASLKQVSGIGGAVRVYAGWNNQCALLADGTLKCSGLNNHGQMGDGTTEPDSPATTVLW
jgi:hypothetical protein